MFGASWFLPSWFLIMYFIFILVLCDPLKNKNKNQKEHVRSEAAWQKFSYTYSK